MYFNLLDHVLIMVTWVSHVMYLIKEAKTESVYYSNALTLNSVTAILDHTYSEQWRLYTIVQYINMLG